MSQLQNTYEIIKAFNNNVVMVKDEGKEKIISGKGIGFNKKQGDLIFVNPNECRFFILQDEENSSKFKELLTKVDDKIVGICEEIISMISYELREELDEKIHVALTDHISFTLYRLQNNDEIENPFLIQTETLYKREYELAEKAVDMLKKETNIDIPPGEIGFIALHIHSARNKGKLSNTIRYAFLTNSIINLVEDELKITIDEKSLDYARFITHIRFAIERIKSNTPIKNVLLSTIKRKFKESYKLAKKISDMIEKDLGQKVVEDEVGYIAIHVEKFKNAI